MPPEATQINLERSQKLNQAAKESLAAIANCLKISQLNQEISAAEVQQQRGSFSQEVLDTLLQNAETKRMHIQDKNMSTFLSTVDAVDHVPDLRLVDDAAIEATKTGLIRDENYTQIKEAIDRLKIELQDRNAQLIIAELVTLSSCTAVRDSLKLLPIAQNSELIRAENLPAINQQAETHSKNLQDKKTDEYTKRIQTAKLPQDLLSLQNQIITDYEQVEITKEQYIRLLEEIRNHPVVP